MRDGILIGIDAGTSVIKSVAFTTRASRSPPPPFRTAITTFPDGGAEQDMARTWTDTAATLQGALGKDPAICATA